MGTARLRKLWEDAVLTAGSGCNRPDLAEQLAPGLTIWAQPLLEPYRYKALYGGRGSGKSYAIADALLILGLRRRIKVLCAREFQNSMAESVLALLEERIEALELGDFYTATKTNIYGQNGTYFLFKGVRHNVQSIKSIPGLTHLWIEEGQSISADSWRVLTPTIRNEGSEIWVSFNPLNESDVVWQQLVAKQRLNAYIERVNWDRNPHFTQVLDEERREMQETDPDAYAHIWEGEFWQQTDAQIFAGKWIIREFEPDPNVWNGPYHGADWGFGSSPTTAVRVWEHDRCLWIERESYKNQLELDDTAALWLHDIPNIDKYTIRSDSARPESISHVKRGRKASGNDPGCPALPGLVGVKKAPGSVEDGIEHIKSYRKIIIHTRCKHMAQEARLYSFKRDRLTNEVLPIILDAHNHLWDGVRYALQPLIKPRKKKNPPAAVSNW